MPRPDTSVAVRLARMIAAPTAARFAGIMAVLACACALVQACTGDDAQLSPPEEAGGGAETGPNEDGSRPGTDAANDATAPDGSGGDADAGDSGCFLPTKDTAGFLCGASSTCVPGQACCSVSGVPKCVAVADEGMCQTAQLIVECEQRGHCTSSTVCCASVTTVKDGGCGPEIVSARVACLPSCTGTQVELCSASDTRCNSGTCQPATLTFSTGGLTTATCR